MAAGGGGTRGVGGYTRARRHWCALAADVEEAAADLLNDLKVGGYKVVFMKPKFAIATIPAYDEIILKTMRTSGAESRPTASVVRTISE